MKNIHDVAEKKNVVEIYCGQAYVHLDKEDKLSWLIFPQLSCLVL